VLVNQTGTSWLATAGSGDVLSGLAGALLAQGLRPASAAASAAYLHGIAARVAATGTVTEAGLGARLAAIRAGRRVDGPSSSRDPLAGRRGPGARAGHRVPLGLDASLGAELGFPAAMASEGAPIGASDLIAAIPAAIRMVMRQSAVSKNR
jgi:Carbohydrate kinase